VPDYAAFASAVDIELLHGLHRAADAEKLLMTRYFPDASIKDGEPPVNGKAKVSQRAEQNVATFGLA
jgi:hypothetical protein